MCIGWNDHAQASFVPQLWQKLAPVGTTVSHFGHFRAGTLLGWDGAELISWPQLGQNFEVDGIWAWHFGQMMRTIDGPALLGVG